MEPFVRNLTVKDINLLTGEVTQHHALDRLLSTPVLKTLCHVCHCAEHKYKCPACSTLSCSLLCTKRHKETTLCTGLKPHIARQKIPVQGMTVQDLRKDIAFMEESIGLSNLAKKKAFE